MFKNGRTNVSDKLHLGHIKNANMTDKMNTMFKIMHEMIITN